MVRNSKSVQKYPQAKLLAQVYRAILSWPDSNEKHTSGSKNKNEDPEPTEEVDTNRMNNRKDFPSNPQLETSAGQTIIALSEKGETNEQEELVSTQDQQPEFLLRRIT